MQPKAEETRIFRFRPEVEAVLTDDGEGRLWVIPVIRDMFYVVGPSIHPSGNGMCLIGEFYGAARDGTRFYMEPGWETPEWWDRVAEPVELGL